MQEDREAFAARGARVAAVGQGTGREAAEKARAWGVDVPIYGDPHHDAYRAFGLGRGGWWSLMVQPFLDDPAGSTRALREADLRASASPRSDVKQLGGVVIVDPGGVVRFLHRAERPDDIPPDAVLLRALEAS